MRNVLLTLSIALLPVLGFSQTFLTQSGSLDTVTGNFTGGTELEVHNNIKSASANSVTLTWKATSGTTGLAAGWKMTGFCDNNTCWNNDAAIAPPSGYVLNGTPSTSLPYTSNFGDFHILYDPTAAANGTSSWVRVNVKDNVSGYERNLTFIGRKGVTGIYTTITSSDEVVLYPNPARDAVNVIYDEKAGIRTIAVYNIIGKLMGPVYKPANNGSARIDLDDMPNGVYFLRLMDGQGHVVATRRFTRQ